MDDEDDDDGAPPPDPRVRVWTNPEGTERLTPAEKERFDIEGQKARRRASLAAAGLMVTEQPAPNGAGPLQADAQAAQTAWARGGLIQQHGESSRWLELLVAKFPSYDPAWSPELQARWFDGFERLLAKGAAL